MTPGQKKRALQILRRLEQADPMTRQADNAAADMAALLQELVDAPEPEPVARVTGYYAGYLSIETVDGRVLPSGTALYLGEPPAQSVPVESAAYESWFADEQGKPYSGMHDFAKAAWLARAAIERDKKGGAA